MPLQQVLIYEMRAPEFGADPAELYPAVLDQAAWAEQLGFDLVSFGEHHGSADGYNPSPLPLLCAVAGRTRRIGVRTSVLLAPLYDPVKLAEDVAVAQLVSGGRLTLGIGGGYVPSEFEGFGRRLEDRWRALGETVELLRLAWTGEPFEWQGRRCRVTPAPDPVPPILLGGGSPAAARRAARIADGFLPPMARLWKHYRQERIDLGHADPGPYPRQGPTFLWISKQPARAWDRLLPHVLHTLRSYSDWTIQAYGRPTGPYAEGITEQTVRDSDAYRVLTPEQAIQLAEDLGDRGIWYLNPLLAGVEPAFAAEMLELYEREVHPYLPGSG